MLFLSDIMSREIMTPICSSRLEFALILAAYPPDEAFIELNENSINGVTNYQISYSSGLDFTLDRLSNITHLRNLIS